MFALLVAIFMHFSVTDASAKDQLVANPAPIKAQNEAVKDSDASADDSPLRVTKNTGGAASSRLIKDAPLRTDYVMGKRNAPVVIVEYASLSCPHCAHFSNTVLPALEEKYIKTGKVVYILRQFALNEPALRGAMLLDCVGQSDEEKYYTFARVLFDAQPRWAFDENFMSGLETIATVGGLSKQQFQACVKDMDREMKVLQAKKSANDDLKIPHTPYFFIGGEAYEGPKNVEEISKFIDAKLVSAAKK